MTIAGGDNSTMRIVTIHHRCTTDVIWDLFISIPVLKTLVQYYSSLASYALPHQLLRFSYRYPEHNSSYNSPPDFVSSSPRRRRGLHRAHSQKDDHATAWRHSLLSDAWEARELLGRGLYLCLLGFRRGRRKKKIARKRQKEMEILVIETRARPVAFEDAKDAIYH